MSGPDVRTPPARGANAEDSCKQNGSIVAEPGATCLDKCWGDAAAGINEQHRLACLRAGEAIDHAKRAGKLLLEVKAAMPHGAFLNWMADHVDVTPRQAQRYMAAALGKPTPVRSLTNATPMSHLLKRPADFEPVGSCAMWSHVTDGCFVVEQSEHDGFFYASRVTLRGDADVVHDFTRRPVRGDYVEYVLQTLGMPDPGAAAWHIARGCRVEGALKSNQWVRA